MKASEAKRIADDFLSDSESREFGNIISEINRVSNFGCYNTIWDFGHEENKSKLRELGYCVEESDWSEDIHEISWD